MKFIEMIIVLENPKSFNSKQIDYMMQTTMYLIPTLKFMFVLIMDQQVIIHLGNISQDEPTFTDLEPSKAGNSGDGYVWKYLFTVSPSDIIKFDSTEYITVPNNWSTSTDSQIRSVRENGNSDVNLNQIKHVYIENAGSGYANGLGQEVDIIGDGDGAKQELML